MDIGLARVEVVIARTPSIGDQDGSRYSPPREPNYCDLTIDAEDKSPVHKKRRTLQKSHRFTKRGILAEIAARIYYKDDFCRPGNLRAFLHEGCTVCTYQTTTNAYGQKQSKEEALLCLATKVYDKYNGDRWKDSVRFKNLDGSRSSPSEELKCDLVESEDECPVRKKRKKVHKNSPSHNLSTVGSPPNSDIPRVRGERDIVEPPKVSPSRMRYAMNNDDSVAAETSMDIKQRKRLARVWYKDDYTTSGNWRVPTHKADTGRTYQTTTNGDCEHQPKEKAALRLAVKANDVYNEDRWKDEICFKNQDVSRSEEPQCDVVDLEYESPMRKKQHKFHENSTLHTLTTLRRSPASSYIPRVSLCAEIFFAEPPDASPRREWYVMDDKDSGDVKSDMWAVTNHAGGQWHKSPVTKLGSPEHARISNAVIEAPKATACRKRYLMDDEDPDVASPETFVSPVRREAICSDALMDGSDERGLQKLSLYFTLVAIVAVVALYSVASAGTGICNCRIVY